jgi:hypothetical protein
MTTMVGTVVYALDAPGDGAVGFARHWDAHRQHDAFAAYRFPTIRSGALRDEASELFRKFVAEASRTDPMRTWAQSVLDSA